MPPAARADRSAEGDRPAGIRRRPRRQRHHVLHRRRQGSQRGVVHQQPLLRVRIGHRRGRHRHRPAEPRRRLLARPGHPERIEPGKRPFHTLIPAMVFKDGQAAAVVRRDGRRRPGAGTPAGAGQPDRSRMNLQQAIDAPRVRYISGRGVMMDDDADRAGDRRSRAARPRARDARAGSHAPRADGRRSGDHDRPRQRLTAGRVGFTEGRAGAGVLRKQRTLGDTGERVLFRRHEPLQLLESSAARR